MSTLTQQLQSVCICCYIGCVLSCPMIILKLHLMAEQFFWDEAAYSSETLLFQIVLNIETFFDCVWKNRQDMKKRYFHNTLTLLDGADILRKWNVCIRTNDTHETMQTSSCTLWKKELSWEQRKVESEDEKNHIVHVWRRNTSWRCVWALSGPVGSTGTHTLIGGFPVNSPGATHEGLWHNNR